MLHNAETPERLQRQFESPLTLGVNQQQYTPEMGRLDLPWVTPAGSPQRPDCQTHGYKPTNVEFSHAHSRLGAPQTAGPGLDQLAALLSEGTVGAGAGLEAAALMYE